MFKNFALALVITSFATAASAVDATPPASAVPATALAAKSGKVDFESLSKAEKIKLIEEKHAASKQKSDAKWKNMSDDQKIAAYQKRRERFISWRQKGKTPADAGFGNAAAATSPAAPANKQ